MNKPTKSKRVAYSAIILLTVAVQLFFWLPKTLNAGGFVLVLKEFVIDPSIRIVAHKMLQQMNADVIEIVQKAGRSGSNDSFDPAFVRNWRSFVGEAQYTGELFFRFMLVKAMNGNPDTYDPDKDFICPEFQKTIWDLFELDKVRTSPGIGKISSDSFSTYFDRSITDFSVDSRVNSLISFFNKIDCTFSDSEPVNGATKSEFKDDFSKGGWEAWRMTNMRQNTLEGVIDIIQEELNKQRSFQADLNIAEAIAGNGFLSRMADRNPDSGCGTPNHALCDIFGRIITPGSVYAGAIQKVIGTEFDSIANADEIGELTAITEGAADRVARILLDLAGGYDFFIHTGNGIDLLDPRLRPHTSILPDPTADDITEAFKRTTKQRKDAEGEVGSKVGDIFACIDSCKGPDLCENTKNNVKDFADEEPHEVFKKNSQRGIMPWGPIILKGGFDTQFITRDFEKNNVPLCLMCISKCIANEGVRSVDPARASGPP